MKKSTGFTLIEILIALLIFAILASMTVGVLYRAFNTRELVERHADRLSEIQTAYLLLSRDFKQCSPRPIFINQTIEMRPFIGKPHQLSLTRGGVLNPLATGNRSELQRIDIQLNNGQLTRDRWQDLDRDADAKSIRRLLLDNVKDAKFYYLGNHKKFSIRWPTIENGKERILPRAVKLELTLSDWGTITWLFPCQGA